MAETYDHLIPAARDALALPVEERVAFMHRDRWIMYDRARAILQNMDRLLHQPPSIRPPCMMVLAAPNNGKSHLIRRFNEKNPPFDDPTDGTVHIPVLLIEELHKPDERSLYNRIIDSMGFPNRPTDPVAKLEYRAHRILIHFHVRVLLIDDFHHLAKGSPSRQRQMLDVLKTMSTRSKISIIGAGMTDAYNMLQLDPHLSTRFTPAPLPAWDMGDSWCGLLATFESFIPLPEPSNLSDPAAANRILAESDRVIGDAWDLIKLMGLHAIETGASRMDTNMIAQVGWIRPSDRVRAAQEQINHGNIKD